MNKSILLFCLITLPLFVQAQRRFGGHVEADDGLTGKQRKKLMQEEERRQEQLEAAAERKQAAAEAAAQAHAGGGSGAASGGGDENVEAEERTFFNETEGSFGDFNDTSGNFSFSHVHHFHHLHFDPSDVKIVEIEDPNGALDEHPNNETALHVPALRSGLNVSANETLQPESEHVLENATVTTAATVTATETAHVNQSQPAAIDEHEHVSNETIRNHDLLSHQVAGAASVRADSNETAVNHDLLSHQVAGAQLVRADSNETLPAPKIAANQSEPAGNQTTNSELTHQIKRDDLVSPSVRSESLEKFSNDTVSKEVHNVSESGANSFVNHSVAISGGLGVENGNVSEQHADQPKHNDTVIAQQRDNQAVETLVDNQHKPVAQDDKSTHIVQDLIAAKSKEKREASLPQEKEANATMKEEQPIDHQPELSHIISRKKRQANDEHHVAANSTVKEEQPIDHQPEFLQDNATRQAIHDALAAKSRRKREVGVVNASAPHDQGLLDAHANSTAKDEQIMTNASQHHFDKLKENGTIQAQQRDDQAVQDLVQSQHQPHHELQSNNEKVLVDLLAAKGAKLKTKREVGVENNSAVHDAGLLLGNGGNSTANDAHIIANASEQHFDKLKENATHLQPQLRDNQALDALISAQHQVPQPAEDQQKKQINDLLAKKGSPLRVKRDEAANASQQADNLKETGLSLSNNVSHVEEVPKVAPQASAENASSANVAQQHPASHTEEPVKPAIVNNASQADNIKAHVPQQEAEKGSVPVLFEHAEIPSSTASTAFLDPDRARITQEALAKKP